MPKLFISYRREDSNNIAGRIYDRLVEEFGKKNVFKDVDSIPLGSDFRQILREAVGECDVVLSVMGKHWIDATDLAGKKRLEEKTDFVRVELEAALGAGYSHNPCLGRRRIGPCARSIASDSERSVVSKRDARSL